MSLDVCFLKRLIIKNGLLLLISNKAWGSILFHHPGLSFPSCNVTQTSLQDDKFQAGEGERFACTHVI